MTTTTSISLHSSFVVKHITLISQQPIKFIEEHFLSATVLSAKSMVRTSHTAAGTFQPKVRTIECTAGTANAKAGTVISAVRTSGAKTGTSPFAARTSISPAGTVRHKTSTLNPTYKTQTNGTQNKHNS